MKRTAYARVVLQPLGEISGDLLDLASRALRQAYRLPVEIAAPEAPIADAYDASRKQYRAGRLLDALAPFRPPDGCVVGIVSADVYGPGTNFLFGLGSSGGGSAIVATARFAMDRRPELVAERVAKAAVHEMGHAIGLPHCDLQRCVMRYSNDLPSFDQKSVRFCARHRAIADDLVGNLEPRSSDRELDR